MAINLIKKVNPKKEKTNSNNLTHHFKTLNVKRLIFHVKL